MSYKMPLRGAHGHLAQLAFGVASIADTGTISTGLAAIKAAVVCHGASTTIAAGVSAFDATITSVALGVITVTIISRTTVPALAAYAVAANVYFMAVG